MGSFICIQQECSNCGYTWKWKNQPFVKDTPAGNILLSASILFSGSTPSKALRMLKYLNMASIKNRTYFEHQQKYLEPAILSVWTEKQSKLLSECAAEGPITIGGDGRADSPGHSAKYGSYGIIDLSTNKVIHVELVQVSVMYTLNIAFNCVYNDRAMK